jgi:hypothetical protein
MAQGAIGGFEAAQIQVQRRYRLLRTFGEQRRYGALKAWPRCQASDWIAKGRDTAVSQPACALRA